MRDRILLCVGGFYGLLAVFMIIGLVALVRVGGVRLALAAVIRRFGPPLLRWLSKAGDRR